LAAAISTHPMPQLILANDKLMMDGQIDEQSHDEENRCRVAVYS